MSDETLQMLAREVRTKTLRLIEDVTDEEVRFAPAGTNNTVLWHAGHAVMLMEHLGLMLITRQPPSYPPDWFEKFSWKSSPAQVKDWPTLDLVRQRLNDQFARMTALLEQMSSDQLNQPYGDPTRGRTIRWAILHGLHDEANHQGEIWLLRKLYKTRHGDKVKG